jgi:hypothetical protein
MRLQEQGAGNILHLVRIERSKSEKPYPLKKIFILFIAGSLCSSFTIIPPPKKNNKIKAAEAIGKAMSYSTCQVSARST